MKKILFSGGKLILLFSIMLAIPEVHAEPKWQMVTEDLSYDKSSIVYPRDKKLLGMTVKDKEIVRVWVRSVLGEHQLEFYCRKRVVDIPPEAGGRMDMNGNLQKCQEPYAQKSHGIELTQKEAEIVCRWGQTGDIRPSSGMEKLMEKVCK